MLNSAYKLLEKQYKQCSDFVKNDTFLTYYANEKWRHSMQVMGAGNFLINHILWLKDKSNEYIDMVKTAILLHDVCRFDEIILKKKSNNFYDHSEEGGKKLRTINEFSDIRVWLPVKHHGHLIEALYDDEIYKSITLKSLQDEVEKICFLIRDADKIANFNMISRKEYIELFLGKKSPENSQDTEVSDEIKDIAFLGKTVPYSKKKTMADNIIRFLSWYADINYQASIDFCQRLNITNNLLDIFDRCCSDSKFKHDYLIYFQNLIKNRNYLL